MLMAQAVPFRLLERWMLVRFPDLSTPVLACYDAAYLFATSTGISVSQQDHFWETWEHWTSSGSILCMLAISLVVFSGYHLCELALLRETTASCFLVYSNISNVVTAALAVVVFGERAWSSPFAILGIFISFAGSMWYACLAARPVTAEEPMEVQPLEAVSPALSAAATPQSRVSVG
mmetsp:Transcript_90046/g.201483  ORF Transcript_90046/g.201483 Transcript_90046/m.201483 type:complete len:177 (-) Transcript_90046:76-606(-)